MTRFVALLRGVNVGGAKRVPMADLRALLSTLGYGGVRTLLNSGNAVFESAGRSTSAHAARIQAALAETLNVEVPVVVKSAQDLAAIEAENGLVSIATDPSRLLVAFTGDPEALRGLVALSPLVAPPEQLLLGRHAVYLWCPDGILASRAGEALLGKLGRATTTRNWATVSKISAMLRQNAGP
jgi:uncharacterized protein (DUF1697 family)